MNAVSNGNVLQGRAAIITGASQGLGLEIAMQYVAAGASVIICARDEGMLSEAADVLKRSASNDQVIFNMVADVAESEAVDALIEFAIDKMGRIDILVNNAGIYGPKGPTDSVDWAQWVQAINVNLLGSVLMCRAVITHMKRQGYGKIVQLSGGGATNPLPNLSSYAVSKAGIVRFIETLAIEAAEYAIDANAIAPGALNTRMLDEILVSDPEAVGKEFYERALQQKASGGAGLEKGARLAVFLGSADSDGITGKLISAIWDPWEELDRYKANLEDSDIYTLRRIVPSDRGLDW
jgi:NAD(P)-dependent dehydrogenase (short-subunit alcohol dehydrogenase family)